MSERNREIDPDFFDVLLQSLSVLSNVATLASAWIVLKQDHGRHHSKQAIDAIRNQLRDLRRNLEDCFEAVESILRILETAHSRTGANLLQAPPRFGAGVLLKQDEFDLTLQYLTRLDVVSLGARPSNA